MKWYWKKERKKHTAHILRSFDSVPQCLSNRDSVSLPRSQSANEMKKKNKTKHIQLRLNSNQISCSLFLFLFFFCVSKRYFYAFEPYHCRLEQHLTAPDKPCVVRKMLAVVFFLFLNGIWSCENEWVRNWTTTKNKAHTQFEWSLIVEMTFSIKMHGVQFFHKR